MPKDMSTNEKAVRELVERYVAAIRSHDIDSVTSAYAPDLVAFDVVPPLQYVGAEAYGNVWRQFFELLEKPIPYEVRDLRIEAGDEVAFSHSLNRNGGTMKSGQQLDLWVRWTVGYRKMDGNWKIAHMQVSVPADLQTGKAMVKLKP